MGAMPRPSKLAAVVALIAVGFIASFGLAWPARDVELYGLSFTLSGRMLLGLVLVGLAWTGTDMMIRQRPETPPQQSSFLAMHGILPVALTAAAWTLLAQLDSIETKLIGVTAASGLLALLIMAEYHIMYLAGRRRVVVQFSLRLMAYWVATLLYIAIRVSLSAGLTATVATAAVSSILGLKLLGDDRRLLQYFSVPLLGGRGRATEMAGHGPVTKMAGRGWLLVLGLGALMGATCWLLGLWTASPLLHALMLVVFLYVLIGLARHFLLGTLTQRVAFEYLLVGVVVLLLLLSYAR
jgi:hypothetical protein